MKKTISVIILMALLGLLVLGAVYFFRKDKETTEPDMSRYREEGWYPGEYDAYVIREKYRADIIWIGPEAEYWEWQIPIRFEKEISEDMLKARKGYPYVYVVINDLDGSVHISDDEYLLIKEYLTKNERYSFAYFGEKDLKRLSDLGFFEYERAINKSDLFVGLFYLNGELICSSGRFTREDKKNDMSPCMAAISEYELWKDIE